MDKYSCRMFGSGDNKQNIRGKLPQKHQLTPRTMLASQQTNHESHFDEI